jgi:hypothetical protein
MRTFNAMIGISFSAASITGKRQERERGDRNESPDAHAVHRRNFRATKLGQQGQVSKCDDLSFARVKPAAVVYSMPLAEALQSVAGACDFQISQRWRPCFLRQQSLCILSSRLRSEKTQDPSNLDRLVRRAIAPYGVCL